MASRHHSRPLAELALLPWWVCVIFADIVYAVVRWLRRIRHNAGCQKMHYLVVAADQHIYALGFDRTTKLATKRLKCCQCPL
jgi:hypothetical protein